MDMLPAVINEANQLRETQKSKYPGVYPVGMVVPNNTTRKAILTIDENADFLVERLTGIVIGPCTNTGIRDAAAATDYPLPGSGTVALVGFATHGIYVSIADSRGSITYTNGPVPFELLFAPGYREEWSAPMPFKAYLKRGTVLNIELKNTDTIASKHHFVSMAFLGTNFRVPAHE